MDKVNYFENLKKYYADNGIIPVDSFEDDKFHCEFKDRCYKSCETIWACAQAYVGEHYNKTRIMVVGMDYGKKENYLITMERQTISMNECIEKCKKGGLNKHMLGTSKLLKSLLNSKDCRVFKYFALPNWCKCAGNQKIQKSCVSSVMKKNCLYHLKKEIKILQPRLIVFQSKEYSDIFQKYIKNNSCTITQTHSENWQDTARQNNKDLWWEIICSNFLSDETIHCLFLRHPSSRGYYKWLEEQKIDKLFEKVRETLGFTNIEISD